MDPDREPTVGTPRWVRVSLIIAAGLVVLFVILNLLGIGSGDHGPGRHGPGLHGLGVAVPVAGHLST